MIKSWADEYDSDMESEYNSESLYKTSIVNTNSSQPRVSPEKNSEVFYKFSDRICEKKCTIDYKLFTTVKNSRYSCLMPWYVNQVNSFLYDIYKKGNFKINKIVDTGANIGVDSINFLLNFPNSKLITFEIEPKTYKALCMNLLEFKYITKIKSIDELTNVNNKIQAYNEDFLNNLYLPAQDSIVYNSDIVFIDAPWGGTIYKDKKNVSLYLHAEDDYYNLHNCDISKNIITVTKKLLNYKYNIKSVLLKVPYNYEFENFENELTKFNSNVTIKYKKIYKGNTSYVAFVLIVVYIKN